MQLSSHSPRSVLAAFLFASLFFLRSGGSSKRRLSTAASGCCTNLKTSTRTKALPCRQHPHPHNLDQLPTDWKIPDERTSKPFLCFILCCCSLGCLADATDARMQPVLQSLDVTALRELGTCRPDKRRSPLLPTSHFSHRLHRLLSTRRLYLAVNTPHQD
jgi:hypothetical protein